MCTKRWWSTCTSSSRSADVQQCRASSSENTVGHLPADSQNTTKTYQCVVKATVLTSQIRNFAGHVVALVVYVDLLSVSQGTNNGCALPWYPLTAAYVIIGSPNLRSVHTYIYTSRWHRSKRERETERERQRERERDREVHTQTYIHTYTHTHTYIYIYIHTHTHTHTYNMLIVRRRGLSIGQRTISRRLLV